MRANSVVKPTQEANSSKPHTTQRIIPSNCTANEARQSPKQVTAKNAARGRSGAQASNTFCETRKRERGSRVVLGSYHTRWQHCSGRLSVHPRYCSRHRCHTTRCHCNVALSHGTWCRRGPCHNYHLSSHLSTLPTTGSAVNTHTHARASFLPRHSQQGLAPDAWACASSQVAPAPMVRSRASNSSTTLTHLCTNHTHAQPSPTHPHCTQHSPDETAAVAAVTHATMATPRAEQGVAVILAVVVVCCKVFPRDIAMLYPPIPPLEIAPRRVSCTSAVRWRANRPH